MSMSARATPALSAAELKVACSSCGLRELCLPVGFTPEEMTRLDGLVTRRTPVPKGASLYRCGERFEALYAVRTGFFKTRTASEGGREHVTGFQMAGELLGLDGVSSDLHTCDAVALEDSQVCVIPYDRIERLSRDFTEMQRQFHKIMGREIVRDHGVMLLLGSMRAEERLAAFLLNLAQRLHARGFSPTALVLRMTREEIGTYLGLKLETVSRCFSRFHEDGVLHVRQREIRIVDPAALEAMVSDARI
jgi:CRP/FNR family transcriptional regulator, anaerobic regulatory protein